MPEYLTPGVYVEETSFRSRAIEGVATSTFGMAGLTRLAERGPAGGFTVAFPDDVGGVWNDNRGSTTGSDGDKKLERLDLRA